MPDITMCCNYDCPIKSKCYRYRAIPDDYWQSFALYKPKDNECDYFWEIDCVKDRILPMEVINNRYEKDWKWDGIK